MRQQNKIFARLQWPKSAAIRHKNVPCRIIQQRCEISCPEKLLIKSSIRKENSQTIYNFTYTIERAIVRWETIASGRVTRKLKLFVFRPRKFLEGEIFSRFIRSHEFIIFRFEISDWFAIILHFFISVSQPASSDPVASWLTNQSRTFLRAFDRFISTRSMWNCVFHFP